MVHNLQFHFLIIQYFEKKKEAEFVAAEFWHDVSCYFLEET